MATYYVNSATGSDNNSGTSSAPFLTIQHASNLTNPGDTVYIMPGNGYGTLNSGGTAVVSISRAGSAGNYITYSQAPGQPRPLLRNQGIWGTVDIRPGANYIIVDGLEVQGNNSLLTLAGAWQIIYDDTRGVGSSIPYSASGIRIGDNGSVNIHHCIVRNCLIYDHPNAGIQALRGDYLTVNNNIVHDNALYSGYGSSGIAINNSVDQDSVTTTKHNIYNNTVYNNRLATGWAGSGAYPRRIGSTTSSTASGGTVLQFSSGHTFQPDTLIFDVTNINAMAVGTYVVSTTTTTVTVSPALTGTVGSGDHIVACGNTDGGGIIFDTSNGGGFSYGGRTACYNNLVFHNGGNGILPVTSDHCDVYFNTCYGNCAYYRRVPGGLGEMWDGGSGTGANTFYNNIFYAVDSAVHANFPYNAYTINNNVAFGGSGTNVGTSVAGIVANPLFINPTTDPTTANFGLKTGSPAIDASSATFTRTADILGNPMTGTKWDIGAYEFAATAGRRRGYFRHRR